jgi:hypothetical protein
MTEPTPPTTQTVVVSRSADMAGVASGLLDVFRTSPVLLLIVLLNAAFAGAGAYVIAQLESQRHIERMAMMERCLPDVNLHLHLRQGEAPAGGHAAPMQPKPWLKP